MGGSADTKTQVMHEMMEPAQIKSDAICTAVLFPVEYSPVTPIPVDNLVLLGHDMLLAN